MQLDTEAGERKPESRKRPRRIENLPVFPAMEFAH